jgi:hypothetical protein
VARAGPRPIRGKGAIRLLLDVGAGPTLKDELYDSTAAGEPSMAARRRDGRPRRAPRTRPINTASAAAQIPEPPTTRTQSRAARDHAIVCLLRWLLARPPVNRCPSLLATTSSWTGVRSRGWSSRGP